MSALLSSVSDSHSPRNATSRSGGYACGPAGRAYNMRACVAVAGGGARRPPRQAPVYTVSGRRVQGGIIAGMRPRIVTRTPRGAQLAAFEDGGIYLHGGVDNATTLPGLAGQRDN